MAGKSSDGIRRKKPLTQGESLFLSVLSGLGVMSLVAAIFYFIALSLPYAEDWSLSVLASPSEQEEETIDENKVEKLPTPPPPPIPPRMPPPPNPPPPLATPEAIPTQTLVALNQEMVEQLEALEAIEEVVEDKPAATPLETAETEEQSKDDKMVEEYLKRRDAERVAEAKKKKAAAKRATLALKLASPPVITKRVTPKYPESVRRAGQEGRVIIKVTVTPKGKASGAQIISSSGVKLLDQAALSAARRFRFRPGKNGLGQPVPAPKNLPFTFQLRDS